jgi:thioredoxin reductase (NADPH)
MVFFPNGDVLVEPDNLTLAERVGLHTEASEPFYDLAIIGGGPAGLGAGVYGASEGLRTVLVEKEATGGQAGTSSRIENYLGFPKGLSGAELAKRATDQAIRLGCEILTAREAVGVRMEDNYKIVTLNNGDELTCQALIIATGVTIKQLDAPGMEKLTGAGIYYGAALTEAPNYEGRHVFVVGGANSAGQAAMYFARYARQVSMLVRETSLGKGMSAYLVDQIEEQENIEVLTRTEVAEVKGDKYLEEIAYRDLKNGQTTTTEAGALFIFIGQQAHTDFLGDLIERNPAGLIVTGNDLAKNGEHPNGWKLKRDAFMLETNIPGIFAVGDVRQGSVHRVASAVGQGAIAVSLVHQYLKTV